MIRSFLYIFIWWQLGLHISKNYVNCDVRVVAICPRINQEPYFRRQNGTAHGPCVKCASCQPGYGVLRRCTLYNDTICTPCRYNMYSSTNSAYDTCTPCVRCDAPRPTTRTCSSTHNAHCGECPQGYYEDQLTGNCKPCSNCYENDETQRRKAVCQYDGAPVNIYCTQSMMHAAVKSTLSPLKRIESQTVGATSIRTHRPTTSLQQNMPTSSLHRHTSTYRRTTARTYRHSPFLPTSIQMKSHSTNKMSGGLGKTSVVKATEQGIVLHTGSVRHTEPVERYTTQHVQIDVSMVTNNLQEHFNASSDMISFNFIAVVCIIIIVTTCAFVLLLIRRNTQSHSFSKIRTTGTECV